MSATTAQLAQSDISPDGGEQYEALGQTELALADYRKAIQLAPTLEQPIKENLRRLGAD